MPAPQFLSQLDDAITKLLDSGALSEFKLIKALQTAPYQIFEPHVFSDDLALFQTHFIVYNALYRLRDTGLANQTFDIDILPTQITKISLTTNTNSNREVKTSESEPETEKLREYYLNWQNFDKTNEQDVADLLDSFWQKMTTYRAVNVSDEQLKRALEALDLTDVPTKSELKAQYKKLSNSHHPDKGGDKETFQQILFAYQLLNRAIK